MIVPDPDLQTCFIQVLQSLQVVVLHGDDIVTVGGVGLFAGLQGGARLQDVLVAGLVVAGEVEGQIHCAAELTVAEPGNALCALSSLQDQITLGGVAQQEVTVSQTGGDVCLELDVLGAGRTQGEGQCGSIHTPVGTVKGEGVVGIQGVGIAIGEAEDRALSQSVALTRSKGCVEVEGQHDGAVGICHTDPANLLVAALEQIAAIVGCQEVGDRRGSRQVGVHLDQVCCTVTVA